MGIVIVGGNECMARRYKDLCKSYQCDAKVYTQMTNGLKDIGNPDLVVLFTSTVSHKMVRCVLNTAKARNLKVVRSRVSSITALGTVLEAHTARRCEVAG